MNPAFEFGQWVGRLILAYAAYKVIRWGVSKVRRKTDAAG
jgi:hypothetical protein